MPHTISTARSLSRELAEQFVLAHGEDVQHALRRIDRAQTEAVCRHLLGARTATSTPTARTATAADRPDGTR